MRARSLFFFALVLPTTVVAQNGVVCIYADPIGLECRLSDAGPGILSLYVIHEAPEGTTAVEFAAPRPNCMSGATWLADASPFPVAFGDSQKGVSIGYGGCLTGRIHALTILYAVSGATSSDCAYAILPGRGKRLSSSINACQVS